MEILTAYARKNSIVDSRLKENSMTSKVISMVIQTNKNAKKEYSKERNIPLDIQAILTVIGRRKNYLNYGESNHLNLEMAYLQGADLKDAHLEGANLIDVNLEGADLKGANLEGADLKDANLEGANLIDVNLEGACLTGANLEGVDLKDANLEGADLTGAHLEEAYMIDVHLEKSVLRDAHLEGADLTGTNLEGADLKQAKNLTIDQLSKVKTLYDAKLDEQYLIPLKEKYPTLFEEPEF